MTECLSKEVIMQYAEIRDEVKELRKRIETNELQLQRMEEEGTVVDCVKGGAGGIQNFKVVGFPIPLYSQKKTLLYARKANLEVMELELLNAINIAEEFINSITDARMRRLLNLKFIEDLTYIQVAHKMGRRATADSVRMEIRRYFEE